MDIAELILTDHSRQRRSFALLDEMGRSDTTALAAVWDRLRILLEVHAEAEEELFYPELLSVGIGAGSKDSAAAEAEEAIDDHNEIRDAITEVEGCDVGAESWWEAVAGVPEGQQRPHGRGGAPGPGGLPGAMRISARATTSAPPSSPSGRPTPAASRARTRTPSSTSASGREQEIPDPGGG